MNRLFSILTIATLLGTSSAFILPFSTQDQQRLLSAAANDDDIDFDAPILKNPVMKSDTPTVLDHEIDVVDDECYLGKYGQYDECVDFGKLCCSAFALHCIFSCIFESFMCPTLTSL